MLAYHPHVWHTCSVIVQAPYRLLKGDDTWMHEAPGFTAVSLKGDSMTIDFWDAHHSSRLMSVSKRASSK